jgi:hypothetical protein
MESSEPKPFYVSGTPEAGELTHRDNERFFSEDSLGQLSKFGLPFPKEFYLIRRLIPVATGIARTRDSSPIYTYIAGDGSTNPRFKASTPDGSQSALFEILDARNKNGNRIFALYNVNDAIVCSLGRDYRAPRNLRLAVDTYLSTGKFPSHLRLVNSLQ